MSVASGAQAQSKIFYLPPFWKKVMKNHATIILSACFIPLLSVVNKCSAFFNQNSQV
ncbi:hypothetical protein YERSI8AC_260143 [Enterobacterales bacterium 8AC]|nr:hypothetical protein YERSI8AC_260143 [Enterobacterales bacterium 8AC]